LATIYITELENLTTPKAFGTAVQAPFIGNGAVAEQSFAISVTSSMSTTSGWSTSTRFVMVHTDTACFLKFGGTTATITATTSAHRVAANETRFYGVNPGGVLAAVTA
jgi:hypothetical protein